IGQGSSADLVRASAAGAASGEFAAALVTAAGAGSSDIGCAGGTAAVQVKSLSEQALLAALPATLSAAPAQGVATLPLVEMPVAGSKRLVVLISGDGGWRDLDKGLAHELNQRGISVVGWNSLRYFWKKRSAAQLGTDLDSVLRTYRQRWQTDDVALVGYSFGADVLPFAYPLLSEEQRRPVRLVSLLGLAHGATFEVRVGGWLGWFRAQEVPVRSALAGLQPVAHQCIYGTDEKDSLCRDLRGDAHMQVRELPGGHHFDRDPSKLAQIIVERWNAASAQL
ncbi:MAG: AcvB/VirJ family lysyl-phosphatidylglycerol hydrolase, partial [Stenotrophomonas sp.]